MAQSFGIAGIVILGILLFSPVNFLSDYLGEEPAMLVYYLLSIGVPLWIVYLIRKKKTTKSTFNFTVSDIRVTAVVMIASVLLLFAVASPVAGLIPIPEFIKKALMDIVGQTSIYSFVVMVVLAPVFEEIIFRGIMLDGLLERYSPTKSILLSSMLFGLVHLNPWQLVTGLVIGIFAGWIFYRTRSLAMCIIIHATANLSGFIIRLFSDASSMGVEPNYDMFGGMPGYIVCILLSLVVLLCCVIYLNKKLGMGKMKVISDEIIIS